MSTLSQTDAELVELLAALGRAYMENNENEKAAHKFWQLVQLGVEDADILKNLALVLARNESLDEHALNSYKKAVDAIEEDEALYLTLATLFLKENVTGEPALKVFRRALHYTPPYEDQLRDGVVKIFRETTHTIAGEEIRQTLLESNDSPELLNLYLSAVWRNEKYDETIRVLGDLYSRSNNNEIYLEALARTLLEKRSRYEATNRTFTLSKLEAQYCLRCWDINKPLKRIADIDPFLDFKNLFLSFSASPNNGQARLDEYEALISEEGLHSFDKISEDQDIEINIDTTFDLPALMSKFEKAPQPQPERINNIDTISIFEITNCDKDSAPGLPIQTFLRLISNKVEQEADTLVCHTEDGFIALSSSPETSTQHALDTLRKLKRYNQVVEDLEIIHLRTTIHTSPIPFMDLEKQGLNEIRKAIKVHALPENSELAAQDLPVTDLCLLTENSVSYVPDASVVKLGKRQLPYFDGEHAIYTVNQKQNSVGEKTAAGSEQQQNGFGKYQILKTLKENTLASTYEGYDPQLQRGVIIKAYSSQAFLELKEPEQLRKQFYDEVRKLNRINHPNVGVIYDAGENGDLLYLVRELIEGKPISKFLEKKAPASVNEVIDYFVKIGHVLNAFHENDVWHKNLKPSNLFITEQKESKLLDGGLLQVRHADDPEHEDLSAQSYSAPEQIQGMKLTQSCDIFQLGIILYETLTGTHPFKAETLADMRIKTLAEDPVPPSHLRADLSSEMDDILLKALAKNPDLRYQSSLDLARDLETFLRNGEISFDIDENMERFFGT